MRHVSLRGRILDDGHGANRGVGLLIDVTLEKALEEQLIRMTVSDGLTGLRNRRGFDQTLRGEWRRCSQDGRPVSLVMLDVDRFKRFNDTYGHLVGDQALIAVGRALTRCAEGISIARYGGEEFALVLPAADHVQATALGERIVTTMRELRVRQAPDWPLTVSVGVATWTAQQGRSRASELLERADQALYAAKRAGRNRAVTDSGH